MIYLVDMDLMKRLFEVIGYGTALIDWFASRSIDTFSIIKSVMLMILKLN